MPQADRHVTSASGTGVLSTSCLNYLLFQNYAPLQNISAKHLLRIIYGTTRQLALMTWLAHFMDLGLQPIEKRLRESQIVSATFSCDEHRVDYPTSTKRGQMLVIESQNPNQRDELAG